MDSEEIGPIYIEVDLGGPPSLGCIGFGDSRTDNPKIDLTTLQAVVESLREDLDTILEDQVPKFEAPSVEPSEDTVLATMFSTTAVSPPPPRDLAKRHRVRAWNESRARKKDHNELEGHEEILVN